MFFINEMVSKNQALTFFLLINYSFYCKISFDQNLLYFLETRLCIALVWTLDTGCVWTLDTGCLCSVWLRCCLLAVWPWTSFFTAFIPQFLICKMGLILVPPHRVAVIRKCKALTTVLCEVSWKDTGWCLLRWHG